MNKTVNVIVICELETLKCDMFQFTEFLKQYSDSIHNVNDKIWIVRDYELPKTPFDPDISNILTELQMLDYATENSNCLSIIPLSVSGRFYGLTDFV